MSADLPSDINEVDIFLAFPDGVYHYVCAECTAICCRGHGFSVLKKEVPVLLTRYPAMESLAHGRAGSVVTMSTIANNCFFLDTDNLCRIEKDLGRSDKPSLCKLFPFNAYRRIGRTIVIYPHFLCPFRLQIPAQPGKVEGTHALIDPAFRSSGLFEPEYANANPSTLALHHSLEADQVIEREKGFLDRCTKDLGTKRFFDVLCAASSDSTALTAFLARAESVIGLPRYTRSAEPDRIDNIMIALASPLRLQLLTLSSEGILRALALGELIIRRVAALPAQPLSPQEVYKFLEEHGSGIRLMARAEEPFIIPKSVKVTPPPVGDAALTFSSFVFLRELQNSGDVLRSFEKAIPESLSGIDRTTLVQIMGKLLEFTHARKAKKRSAKSKNADQLDSHSDSDSLEA